MSETVLGCAGIAPDIVTLSGCRDVSVCYRRTLHRTSGEGGWESGENPRSMWAGPARLHTRQWWFCLGQLFCTLLSRKQWSASLTEVVYGVSLSLDGLGIVLGWIALLVWWGLLFAGPVALLRRMATFQSEAEQLASIGVYAFLLVAVMVISAVVYSAQGGGSFLRSVSEQVYQPLTWHNGWRR